jgi:hypothetical protein
MSNAIIKPLSPRLQLVVNLLPKYNWQVSPAAIEAGFSQSYAEHRLQGRLKKEPAFQAAVAEKQRELQEVSGWTIEKWMSEAVQRYREAVAVGDRTNVTNLLRLLGMSLGTFEKDSAQQPARIGILINGDVRAENTADGQDDRRS